MLASSLNPEEKKQNKEDNTKITEKLITEELTKKYCLVLDLDETLIHFKIVFLVHLINRILSL